MGWTSEFELDTHSDGIGIVAAGRSLREAMADDPIPDEVRDFIFRHIDSVGQLEALLLMRGNADQRWNSATMARRLYTSEKETEQLLARLCEDGLIACEEGSYWYSCSAPEQARMVERLAASYARQLVSVTNIIHAKNRRIREFANAFRMRKER